MIEVKHLSKSYDKVPALHDINISVPTGTVHGVIGENGSGKTTLIKCLTGIYRPEEGEILIDGESVYENPKVKRKIGYVADGNQYFPSYRVENLQRFYKDMYPTFSEKRFLELAKIFGVPKGKRIMQISKGQQMRVSFALNMACYPEVLIMDEPTSGLDVIAKKELLDEVIREVEERQMTVIISSHHLSELEKICDSMTMIRHGRVKLQNSVENVKGNVRKYQVVLPNGAPEGLWTDKHVLDASNIGSIYTVVIQESEENFPARMKAMGAVLTEEMELSLEEVFIYSNLALEK